MMITKICDREKKQWKKEHQAFDDIYDIYEVKVSMKELWLTTLF